MVRTRFIVGVAGWLWFPLLCCSLSPAVSAASLDLSKAVVVSRPGRLPSAEKTAATVLVEELETRTGIRLSTSTAWPEEHTVIAMTSRTDVPGWKRPIPVRRGTHLPETRPDGYRLYVEEPSGGSAAVWIIGADARATLYGVGRLLRKVNWAEGMLALQTLLDLATAPVYSIRGHQQGKSRARLSWQVTMWPVAMVYPDLDPNATCVIRTAGYGQAVLRINGERVKPVINGKETGEFKVFSVPAKDVKTRKLVLTWDRPKNGDTLNWRKKSRLAEVWLIKKSDE